MKHLLSVLATFVLGCSAEYTGIYYKYPNNYIPTTGSGYYMDVFDSDSEYYQKSRDYVLDKYGSPLNRNIIYGYVFSTVTPFTVHAIVYRNTSIPTPFMELEVNTNYDFYELPTKNHGEFLDKYFALELTVNKREPGPTGTTCMIKWADIPTSTDANTLCRDLPRCAGYVEDKCLVGNVGHGIRNEAMTGNYYEKRLRHNVFMFLSDNWVIFVVSAVVIIIGQTYMSYRKGAPKRKRKRSSRQKIPEEDPSAIETTSFVF